MRRIARWLLFLFVIMGVGARLNGQSVTIGWSASPDPTTTGYIIYWGTVSGNYTDSEDVGTNTTVTISNLTAGITYYFAATSFNATDLQGAYSTEIAYPVPAATAFTFANLTQTYNGALESVTVTTSPANVPVTVTYNGSTNAPVNAGAYTVVATAQSPGSGSATSRFIISPAAAGIGGEFAADGLAVLGRGAVQILVAFPSNDGKRQKRQRRIRSFKNRANIENGENREILEIREIRKLAGDTEWSVAQTTDWDKRIAAKKRKRPSAAESQRKMNWPQKIAKIAKRKHHKLSSLRSLAPKAFGVDRSFAAGIFLELHDFTPWHCINRGPFELLAPFRGNFIVFHPADSSVGPDFSRILSISRWKTFLGRGFFWGGLKWIGE